MVLKKYRVTAALYFCTTVLLYRDTAQNSLNLKKNIEID